MPHHPVGTIAMDPNILQLVPENDRVSLNPTRTHTATLGSRTTQAITTTITIPPSAVTITQNVVTKTFVEGMMPTKEIARPKWTLIMSTHYPPNLGADGRRIWIVNMIGRVGERGIENGIAIEGLKVRTAVEIEV